MSCEVAGSSPFHEHGAGGIESPWAESIENSDFDAIVDFNASFDDGDNHNIDPKSLSKPASPVTFHRAFADDGALNPDPMDIFTAYPTDVSTITTTPYYYLPSSPATATFAPRHLQGRQRSISDPPDGFMQHHRHPQSQLQMTFHREGHYLGEPQPRPLKSLPKVKHYDRLQPYKCKTSRSTEQQRYRLGRSQTRPVRQPAPTSVPRPSDVGDAGVDGFDGMPMPLPVYVSTRVCTPVPEETPALPQQSSIDPMLSMASEELAGSGDKDAKAVSIALTVDELKAMIVDAVRKAVQGLKNDTADGGGQEGRKDKTGETEDGSLAVGHDGSVCEIRDPNGRG